MTSDRSRDFLLLVPFFFRARGQEDAQGHMFFWVVTPSLPSWSHPRLAFPRRPVPRHLLRLFLRHGPALCRRAVPRRCLRAQGFIAFVTLGAGMFVGGLLNGWWNACKRPTACLTGRRSGTPAIAAAVGWSSLPSLSRNPSRKLRPRLSSGNLLSRPRGPVRRKDLLHRFDAESRTSGGGQTTVLSLGRSVGDGTGHVAVEISRSKEIFRRRAVGQVSDGGCHDVPAPGILQGHGDSQ